MLDFSAYDLIAAFFCVVCLLALTWMAWLYLITFKDNQSLRRDNYRLMRRLGRYHSITIGPDDGDSDPLAPPQKSESIIPPFFRVRRPAPPTSRKG